MLASSAAAAARPAPPLHKLDSHLRALLASGHVQRAAKRQGMVAGAGGRILVDVYVNGRVSAAAARLRAIGMHVDATTSRPPFRIVEGRLTPTAARRVARLGVVQAVLSVPPALLAVGAKTSQGDAAHHGPQARALGPNGAGVDVGIISDSINQVSPGVAGSKTTGDLPSNVQVLSEQAGGTDEGRAMAEIVYDEAPGIPRILFGTAIGVGPVGKAATIDNLVAAGADVIADDTGTLNEPFFQDGVVAQAVDRARANGVAYFTSAGNQRRQSWEGTFSPSASTGPAGGALNDFDPSATDDPHQSLVSVPAGANLRVFLQWDDRFGQASTNLDVHLTMPDGSALAGATQGTTDNVATGFPLEFAKYTNSTAAPVTVAVDIERVAGTRSPFMKYIVVGDGVPTFTIAEHATNSDTIGPDAATARGSITVGAVDSSDPGLNDAEPFSSRGPKTVLFDSAGNRLATPEVRQKPEIAAADNVSTTVPTFDPFFGTSAAVPSAAGIAALLRSAKPSLTPDGVRAIMTDPRDTIDCTTAGRPDTACGFGFVLADGGVTMAQDASPPVVTPQLSPSAPGGLNGFFTSDVGVTWAVSDPDSPVYATSACGPAAVTGDTTGLTLSCNATSAGGTTDRTATVKRDASPPTTPTFTGIAARSYQVALVPARFSVSCAATDPTSGLDPTGCIVSGYSRALGAHTLIGSARNNAGLSSTASLRYVVVPNAPAIARLSAPRSIKLRSLLRGGLAAKLDVARPATSIVADLIVRSGSRKVRAGHVAKRLGAGRRTVSVTANPPGKRLLSGRSRTTVQLVVTGTPQAGARRTLRRNFVVKR